MPSRLERAPNSDMALTQRLEIRQSHALVMTPQLMQAIKLLQLSNLDLAAYVEGELERNPLLERAGESEAEPAGANSQPAEAEPRPAADGSAADWLGEDLATSRTLIEDQLVARLDLVAKRDLAALRRICGVDGEDLAEMIAEIRRLNPKPGLAFGSTLVQPIVPDVFVRAGPDGGRTVELNSDTLPKVLLNQSYYAEIAGSARDDSEKSYLADCLQTASWLIRALDQRARTILKVSTEIVRQQDSFFVHGVQHLRPLNLKTVADAIGMHESTVSRVTANKYMATMRGIFELKYFFTSAIAAADGGEAHSAEAVRHRIKQLIDAERPDHVLSDDTIVERLRTAGVDIARRTVAKYREAMRIPSSVQRRRDKQVAGVMP